MTVFFFLIGIEVQYIAVFRMLGFFVAVPRYKNADQIFKKALLMTQNCITIQASLQRTIKY